jgi:hypothetical protein
MQQEQDHADYQDDVDEAGGHVKCEKAQQPENDQDCGDNPKHEFISLFSGAGTSAMRSWLGPRMMAAARKCAALRIDGVGRAVCPVMNTFADYWGWGFAGEVWRARES